MLAYREAGSWVHWTGGQRPLSGTSDLYSLPANVEGSYSDAELAAYGLHRVVTEPVHEGKQPLGYILVDVDGVPHRVDDLVDLPPEPPRRLSAYRIVRRIEDAGMIEAASAYLDAHSALRWRFQTADSQGGILVDDPDLLAGLSDLGLTEQQIEALLAPE